MKKSIMLVALCLCFANVVYAQGRYQYKDADTNVVHGITVLRSTGEPVNGVVYAYHDTGNLRSEVIFKDGKAEGIARFYDENGKLISEISYYPQSVAPAPKVAQISDFTPATKKATKTAKISDITSVISTYSESRQDNNCPYRINGICTTEDIGGVQVYILKNILPPPPTPPPDSIPLFTPDSNSLYVAASAGVNLVETIIQERNRFIQESLQNYQMELQRYQLLMQYHAMQGNNQQLRFENNNDFPVSIIFEVQESTGAKKTNTIVLNAKETKDTTYTFVEPISVTSITRRY